MLIVSKKIGEDVMMGSRNYVRVLGMHGNQVRLGIGRINSRNKGHYLLNDSTFNPSFLHQKNQEKIILLTAQLTIEIYKFLLASIKPSEHSIH